MSHIDDGGRRGRDHGALIAPPLPREARPVETREPRTPHRIDSESDEVRRLVRVLVQRRWQILLVAVLVVVPAIVFNALAERMYRSTALVQIDPEPVQVLPYREFDQPSVTSNYEMFLKSQEQVLKGATLTSRVAARLAASGQGALAAEVPELYERFAVQRVENTQIFRIAYVAASPAVAARVANTYAEEFIKLHFETRQQTRERARQLLERELESLEERVQNSEKTLVTYAQDNRMPANEPDKNLVQQKLSTLDGQVTDAEAEVATARSRLDSLRAASTQNLPEKLVTPVITGLAARLAQLEQEITVLRASYGENWPAVVQKRSEIALVREQLDGERAKALAQARDQATLDYTAAEAKRKLLAASMAEQSTLANQLETASIQYNIIKREVDTNRKMYEGILERLKQTSVTAGMEFGGFHVIEPALPNSRVYSPRVWWNLLLASLLGLAMGACVSLARDFWDTSVSTVEEVEHITVVPVLATLPLVRSAERAPRRLSGWRARLGQGTGALSGLRRGAGERAALPARRVASDRAAAEGLRTLCASILLSRSARPPRVLMVTSAAPGEGKTMVVEELGRTFAETGARTLLVECDMRRPALARSLGIDNKGGLSLFLSGHLDAAPVIQPTDNSHLFVVAAGPPAPNPPILLGSEKMRTFLRDTASSFQFVILDVPPVLPMADARVLAPMVEGVVLVVRAGRVARTMVRRVSSVLEDAGARVLGAVLNGVDPKGPSASDYHYYYDHYGE